jgi:WhiB family redox-sensing transcriptional regulator
MAVSTTTAINGIELAPKAGSDEWRQEALCAEANPDAFFPDKHESAKTAKQICAACTVREQCLDYAITNGEGVGVWGGLSASERRRIGPNSAPSHAEATRRRRDSNVLELRNAGRNAASIAVTTGLNERTVHRIISRDNQANTAQIAV